MKFAVVKILATLQILLVNAQEEKKPQEKIISRGGDVRLRFVKDQNSVLAGTTVESQVDLLIFKLY